MTTALRSGARLAAAAVLLAGAGCAVGPDYRPPAPPATPAAYNGTGPWKPAVPKDLLPKGEWWKIFDDPVLDGLEAQAASASPTLQAALARVSQAAAEARISRAALLPSLDVSLNPSRGRYSANREQPPGSPPAAYTTNSIDLPLALSYEVDLFGRLRRELESARALAQAQASDYENVRLSLQAFLAEDYFALRSLAAQQGILAHTVDLRRQELDLVRTLRQGGAADDLDVRQAEAELDSVESQKLDVDRQVADQRLALAVLAGRMPEGFPVAVEPLPDRPPPAIPAGLPSELLERRPDVAAAERTLAAVNAQVGVAKSAFFPSIGLTAFAGQNSTAFNNLLDSGSREWAIAPFVSLPLFAGGENLANYRRAQAAYNEELADYRQQVLAAFQDVETGLSDLRYLAAQASVLNDAAAAATAAADLSELRYRRGVADYFEVIDAQRTALDDQLQAVSVQGQRWVASVVRVKALGGGW